ncbi:facilitated trehalose transporter Tret1-like isoform X3 [Belonocnema kinseyi]|uniref:facilitated trehalose transporter Tret1-like isoform X3 n=1 Tax=Belonocnema kinseyi TaxID=2817044 RepID=UPI00143CEB63|nr:facilitated trehalose transporter Tret1-like isoform X3 [Belonocnema kinseyi]
MNYSTIEKNKKWKDIEHEILEDCRRKPKKRKSVFWQYATAVITSLTVIGYGCIVSWTSPALPYLTSQKSQFTVTETQSSWIASLVNVGMILGYISNALMIDKIGRKRTILVLSIPQVIASVSIFLARNWIVLCISRVIIGIGYGGGLCATTTYLSEIGDKKSRGIFLSMIKLSLNAGIFFVMLLGAYLTYNTMNLVLMVLPLIFILTFSLMPDTSYWSKKKEETPCSRKDKEEKGNRVKNLFSVRSNRKALLIVCLIVATECLSGHAAIMAYTQEIFDYSPSLSAEYSTLVFGGMKLIGSFFCTHIIERVDRKVLFLGSGILATIAQGILGIFFFLKFNMQMNVSSASWVPLFGITMYEIVGNAGIGSMGFVYSGELFSPDTKGLGITFSYVIYDAIAFLVKLQYHAAVKVIGISGTFFLFSAFCATGTGIVLYIAPETRGKSLKEIQEIISSRKMVDQ